MKSGRWLWLIICDKNIIIFLTCPRRAHWENQSRPYIKSYQSVNVKIKEDGASVDLRKWIITLSLTLSIYVGV